MRVLMILFFAIFSFGIRAHAQTKKLVREGNKKYDQKDYKGAAEEYQKALQKNPSYTPGLFNLGNSLYQQKNFEMARKALEATAKTATAKNEKAAANYNIGNSYMQEQKWQEAVDAYKEALRKNPQDADAKYNLSYAMQKLKQQQGGGGKDDKDEKNKDDKKDNKDQKNKDEQNKDQKENENKDQQNNEGDKDKDKQDQKDKGEGDKNKKEEQQKDNAKPQPKPGKLSKQQAEQILNALQQEEKKLQDKMKKGKAVPVKTDKDW